MPSRPPHTLADHALGALADHAHDGEADHDHDGDPRHQLLDALEARTSGTVPLISIGVDIGSSGTRIVFSRLEMRGPGEPEALRRHARSRTLLSVSPVSLTPWRTDGVIDVDRLRAILERAFAAAGLTPDDIDTGVVIVTGEAARRDNAQAIVDLIAREAGDIVAATAGHHMEAMLAAHGSGALRRSLTEGSRLLLVDIGGATTKLALCDSGRVIATAALHIGGRLMAVDRNDIVNRLETAVAWPAQRAGINWSTGDSAPLAARAKVGAAMADLLVAALTGAMTDEAAARLWLTSPPGDFGELDGVMFSGGVAEFIYGHEKRDFGDLGLPLGQALRARIEAGALPWRLLPAGECLRATAMGASAHAVQMSGETIWISAPARLLPRRNLPVLSPAIDLSGDPDPEQIALAIAVRRGHFDLDDAHADFALALRWRGPPDHARLLALAKGLMAGHADRIAAGRPLFLMLEGDIALNLGAILTAELGLAVDLLALDGLVLRDFDYVDIGRLRLPSGTVPVVIKSLVFTLDQTKPR